MKRVHAVGYYGWNNFGDELFRAVVTDQAEKIWGDNTRVRTFVTPIRALHQNLGFVGRATRLLEMAAGAIWANTIALCGGSVLENIQGTQRVRTLAIASGRSAEAIGVSLGPWANEEAKFRVTSHLRNFDRLVVRDQESQRRFGGNVRVGGDLAALYPMPEYPLAEREYLTICLSNDSGASVDQVSQLLIALLQGVQLPVKLVALNVRPKFGDVEFTHAVHNNIRHLDLSIEIDTFKSVSHTVDILAKSRAVWSQRLHGLIVAYLSHVPILALSHHQKITDFANHIGLPGRYLAEDLTPNTLLRSAAMETLTGVQAWGIAPRAYIDKTEDAIRAISEISPR